MPCAALFPFITGRLGSISREPAAVLGLISACIGNCDRAVCEWDLGAVEGLGVLQFQSTPKEGLF